MVQKEAIGSDFFCTEYPLNFLENNMQEENSKNKFTTELLS